MMIIWSGLGFLVLVFLFCGILGAIAVVNALFGADYVKYHSWVLGASLFVPGALCWFVGNYLTKIQTKILIDKETGKEIAFAPNHSLFFIRMKWWGPICFVLGVVVIFIELFSKFQPKV